MKRTGCEYEPSVLQAVKSDQWDPSVRSHYQSCSLCQEQAQTATWMKELSNQTLAELLPARDYGVIWLRAQFHVQHKRERKALRPLLVFQFLAGLIFVGSIFILSYLNAPLGTDFAGLLTSGSISAFMSQAVLPLILILTLLVVLGAVSLILTLNAFVRE